MAKRRKGRIEQADRNFFVKCLTLSVLVLGSLAFVMSNASPQFANLLNIVKKISGIQVVPTIVLDDFEQGLRVINPRAASSSNPAYQYLWNQYEDDWNEGPDPGSEAVVLGNAVSGKKSLKIMADGGNTERCGGGREQCGNAYMQFLPNDGVFWKNASELVRGTWQTNTYNRMKFWIRVPEQTVKATGGQTNMNIGTYLRSKNGSRYSSEDNKGGHYYHHFNIPYTGRWHQVIVDTHPNHRRGESGYIDPGNLEHPTGEPDFNYFDALTRFYVNFAKDLPSYPGDFYFDKFYLYKESRSENVDQVYSLNGVYVPSDNLIYVGWMRHKTEDNIKHEVRYSFRDIFAIGWSNAKPAPNGIVSKLGAVGYNGMEYTTSEIDVTGRRNIYIAIKPQNSDLFRQIAIPISGQ